MPGKIYFKEYNTANGTIVAMCDEELLGRELKEGKRKLDLKRYADFYRGELLGDNEIEVNIHKIYSANIVGERAVSIVISKGMASEDEIMTIEGVKFIQLYRLLQ